MTWKVIGYTAAAFAFVLAALAVEVFTISMFIQAKQIESWPTTNGTILRSEVNNFLLQSSLVVEYQYVVEGKSYTSSEIRTRGTAKDQAQADVAKYPVGRQVPVHYEPGNPANAYLEVGVDIDNYIIIIAPLLCVGLAVYVLYGILWQRKDPITDKPIGQVQADGLEAVPGGIKGPDIRIDCPACNAADVSASTYNLIERDELAGIPLTIRSTWVVCSHCGNHLLSQRDAKELPSLS